MAKSIKSKLIGFKVSPEEHAFLKQKAKESGMTISRFCLNILRNKKTINNKEVLNIVINYSKYENKLENNINQIAKNLNATHVLSESSNRELIKILNEVQDVRLRNLELMKDIISLLKQ